MLGFFGQAKSAPNSLVVEFETTPLFKEANFLPGEGITRWIKVTNNSGSRQRIATEAINKNDPNEFSEKLNLVIKEGETVIFNDTLKKFFDQGETYLSDLANGSNNQYDFIVSFTSDTDNSFQEKTLGFDIIIGFEGTEGGLPLPSSGEGTGGGGGGGSGGGGSSGGGGGGGLPPGLTIQNEATATTTETSVTFIWTTSYPASSQVIYALESESHTLDLTDTVGAPPKYGYERTTLEYDISPKVTSHSVTIDGLTSGTTYYYRTVSHASLAISEEHSFTTLGEMVVAQQKEKENVLSDAPSASVATIASASVSSEKPEQTTTEQTAEQSIEESIEQSVAQTLQLPLLAAIGDILTLGTSNVWLGILASLIILAVIVYVIYLLRKRKNSGNI